DYPLQGVPNRSWRERWQKRRRRRPHELRFWLLLAVAIVGGAAAAVSAWVQHKSSVERRETETQQRQQEIKAARQRAQQHREQREYALAVTGLEQAIALARDLPGGQELAAEINNQLEAARKLLRTEKRGRDARELQARADHIRLQYSAEGLGPA